MRPLSDRPTPAWLVGLAALVLAEAAILAYGNSLTVPFVFDDAMAIQRNDSIRQLWPPAGVLQPPFDTSVTGRPVLNLSFAVNYALGRLRVQGYHIGNLLIHVLAGLTLFGLVRRTLARVSGKYGPGECTLVAFAVALLWIVHPLQTESVTYVVQRAESLMGLFYLLTLYCFVRGAEGPDKVERLVPKAPDVGPAQDWNRLVGDNQPYLGGRRGWWLLSTGACFLGMATKEVMVSAPIIVLLYDRTFVAGNFREAWRRRRGYYLGLASSWLLVAWLAFGTKSRNGTAGFGTGVSWWDYILTQFPAVTRYLRLSFWPLGQVFDYGTQWVGRAAIVLPAALLVAVLAGSTLWALWRRPALGFLGAWFFAILAPTSLVPGNRQTMAEHRMYLALAPVLILAVLGLRWACAGSPRNPAGRNRVFLVVALALAVALVILTARRNRTYLTNFALWQDTVVKRPGNYYARNNLGNFLLGQGRFNAALAQYHEALRLKPDFPEGHNNLGAALARAGRLEEAKAEYRTAIGLRPDYYPDAHNNLGVVLARGGDHRQALQQFEEVLKVRPDYLEVRFNRGNELVQLGRTSEAVAAYQEAMRRGLDIPQLHNNLGNALVSLGRSSEALAQYAAAVRIDPNFAEGYNNLGTELAKADRLTEAIRQFQHALRLRPRAADVRLNLANALAKADRLAEAETQYREVLVTQPNSVEALDNLGNVLAREGRLDDAVAHYQAALRLLANNPEAHNNLGAALLRLKRIDEARKEFETALRLKPGYAKARDNLNRLLATPPNGPRRPPVPGL